MVNISGFTIVRHGEKFNYPYLESIQSLLPLVDEMIINVGYGEDSTLLNIQKLQATHPLGQKIRIFESDWQLDNPIKRRDGLILSEQTNLALQKCVNDWCFYLQADEVLHENDVAHFLVNEWPAIRENTQAEAVVFPYLHFYGNYNTVQKTRSAYRREVRLVRRSQGATSIGDAQSFRMPEGRKPNAVLATLRILHYGWVRPPETMKEKTAFMDTLYQAQGTGDNYRYKRFWGLEPFSGDHPAVMSDRIARQNWKWNFKESPFEWTASDLKKIPLDLVERWTGHRFFEYRSYKIIN